jgi:hypothetical protein
MVVVLLQDKEPAVQQGHQSFVRGAMAAGD